MIVAYTLSEHQPFARGTARLCFVHPEDPEKMIKVLRPEASPSALRAQQRPFKRWLFRDEHYDANLREINRYVHLYRKRKTIPNLAPFYETVETDLGPGIVTQLLRDHDGSICKNLRACKEHPDRYHKKHLLAALEELHQKENAAKMFNGISASNVVVQKLTDTHYKIWIVDGIFNNTLVPISDYVPAIANKRKKRKLENLREFIEASFY